MADTCLWMGSYVYRRLAGTQGFNIVMTYHRLRWTRKVFHMTDKKCPKCGLWSTGSALLCDCGYDFEKGIKEETLEKKGPSPWLVAALMAGLGLGINFGYVFTLGNTGMSSGADAVYYIYYLVVNGVVTSLAVDVLAPKKRVFLTYIGVLILCFIPFACWLAYYWAGKRIAIWISEGYRPGRLRKG